jgi:hypothetical protein
VSQVLPIGILVVQGQIRPPKISIRLSKLRLRISVRIGNIMWLVSRQGIDSYRVVEANAILLFGDIIPL